MSKNVIMDGNQAAAYISYAFTEVAGIFPITPSSPMAEYVDEWAAKGKLNIFNKPVKVIEMQSEGGAAGTVHGSLQAGALTTTYTASQGLLLMIPNMYKIAGEMLPGVFHVSARTLSAHALSIFGDHSDINACRSTGFAMLASTSPQEVIDLGAIAHLSAIEARMPFLHFFDGFRTSHEIQKINALEYDELADLVNKDKINEFRANALNPEHPVIRGTTVNPDIFFQTKEAANDKYDNIPDIVEYYMTKINEKTGRDYHLFNYYGANDATKVIILMGSGVESAKEAIDYLQANNEKVGLINVHLYRPFSIKHFLAVLPTSVKKVAVLDRDKQATGIGELLYQDVCTIFKQENIDIEVVGGRFGLSSKDTTPNQFVAVFNNLSTANPQNNFTIGINDDVYYSSLVIDNNLNMNNNEHTNVKIWGMGSDGTVGANKNSIKIIGESTDLYTQAYFVYDSKKSGGLTQSHLRFGKTPIRSPYLVHNADFVACHNASYVTKYDMIKDLKEGGTFLLNCHWNNEQLNKYLPASMKRALALKNINFYTIDAVGIAKKLGLKNRINTILQASFFKLAAVIPLDEAISEIKKAIHKSYFIKKGQAIVDMNNTSIDYGISELNKISIPTNWLEAEDEKLINNVPAFIKEVVQPMNAQEGDSLPVSIFKKYHLEDGTWYSGTTQYEKRGAAVDVPEWLNTTCIQCNRCSLVCPHAAIRPILVNEEEATNAPESFTMIKAKGQGLENYQYRIQVSPYDCTGCGVCEQTCPSITKSLIMKPLSSQLKENDNWNYAVNEVSIKKDAINDQSIKNSQYAKPYFEFSGSCAGCGETPYIKLVSQLFGDHMFIANASGCSSAFGGSTPSIPYTLDKDGKGPAWAMSLFEDNAEYALGFKLGYDAIRVEIMNNVKQLIKDNMFVAECQSYLDNCDDINKSELTSKKLFTTLKNSKQSNEAIEFIINNKDYLSKKSFWAFGGDGWAYDIGYGGLDHVLASNENINILVLDTEVYSNTGGQSSKATSSAAIAKFAAGGKETKKKNLGTMLMSYGYVYVAQVAMGYDQAQTLKAIREAEAYEGPSIIIAYAPCIEHGIKAGMINSQDEMKRAVEVGYWHLYRYNPVLKKQNKNPFILDSKQPQGDLKQFIRGENRYASLEVAFPDKAERLYNKLVNDAQENWDYYNNLAQKKED
ncbi:MAG: pyruvate:ferredoxin (flavodoxin) oxidoreductase [Bacilli bacterium]|jgi:pyruvate-ferredoxin/flavodoxin oxidoreductase|nr:pyruvate:ferredoxin (flavodoxin) oxidoreductase [Bacilli bacterium]